MRARPRECDGDARGGERASLLAATTTATAAVDAHATTSSSSSSMANGVGAIAVDIPPLRRDGDDDVDDSRARRRGYGRVGAAVSIAAAVCALAAFGVRERGARGAARLGSVDDAYEATLPPWLRESDEEAVALANSSSSVPLDAYEAALPPWLRESDEEAVALASSSSSAPLGTIAAKEVAFLTYSDRVTAGVCMTGETAAMNGIPLHMIGVDRENGLFDFSNVQNVKTRKLFAFLKVLDDQALAATYGIVDNTIVSVGDATDVLYFQPSELVVNAYKELEKLAKSDKGVVVVSSERNCWPWMLNDVERIPGGAQKCAEYPQDVGTSFKYLNSGNLIGRASALRALLKDVIDRMQSVNEDDQQILAEAYLRQVAGQGSPAYTIALDPRQQIFQTAYDTALETPRYDSYAQSDAWYDRAATSVRNQETRVSPAIVHFNGIKDNLVPVGRHYMNHHRPEASYEQTKHDVEERYPWFHDVCAAILDKLKNPELEIIFSPEQAKIVNNFQSYLGLNGREMPSEV